MTTKPSTSSLVLRRIAAFLYDSLLLVAIFFTITAIALYFNDGQAIHNTAYYLLLYLIACSFFCWFWSNGGQTLGMQAWRIQVVSEFESKLSYKQSLQRFLLGSALFGITLILALINQQGQGPHDKLSRSKIIYKNNNLNKQL